MKAKEFIIVENRRGIRENEQLTKDQIQDKIDHTKKLIAVSRSMKNLSIIPNLENSLKNLEAQLKTAPDRVEPSHKIDNTPVPKGYKYEPYREEELDGDNAKIFHYITLPNGKRVDADFTPYQEMSGKDISLWVKLGMPKRQGIGPLDSEELEQMARDQGVAEAGNKRLEKLRFAPGREWQAPGYPERVAELEAEGLTTSDAQAVADAEVMSGNYTKWSNNLMPENSRNEMDTPEFQRALASLKKKAQQGPMKTVYDPRTGKYKVVPVKSKGE